LKKFYFYILGLLSGLANGIFGSGGGMIVVPLLEKAGIETHKAHATSVAVILPLSILSSFLYYSYGHFNLADALKFLPGGILGAITGCFLLRKIPDKLLKRGFGVILIIAGIRLLIK